MLLNIHVKNLALIDEVDVSFKDHLNILTGETGAGKSVLIGSVHMALGGRMSKDMIRKGAQEAVAELFFTTDNQEILERLVSMDIPLDGDQIAISRRLTRNRSVCRINGELVSAAALREIGSLLMDLHGQHENQSLLDESRHILMLDRFLQKGHEELFEQMGQAYGEYHRLKEEALSAKTDSESRAREMAYIRYEVDEIEEARLQDGEDEQLEADYRRMLHGRQILESMTQIHQMTGYDSGDTAGEQLGRALRIMAGVEEYDEAISPLKSQLEDVENLLNDFNRELSAYISGLSFSEDDFKATEERLDQINRLKSKYGPTIPAIKEYVQKRREELDKLEHYETYLKELDESLKKAEEKVEKQSDQLHSLRQRAAGILEGKIEAALKDLNFNDVRFHIHISDSDHYTRLGKDKVLFLIAPNRGEDLKPLDQIASGGELSRMMLALKTVLADSDAIETLIFDEIDAGISGRTAQKVAEKLAQISRARQVLCITHLPQIAAMADNHYLIEKHTEGERTITTVHELSDEEKVEEIGRLTGGVEITRSVRESAAEMKKMAEQFRKTCLK